MKIAIFALIALACVAGALSVPAGRFELFNRQSHPSDWTVIGHATGSESVDFIVALKQRNLDVLDAKFWAISTPGSPEYRNFLTTEEINDIVRPEQKDFDRVIAWLKDAGVESMKDHGDSIVCRSSAMVAAELFSTEFHVFVNKQGQNITRAYGSMSIPMELQGIVEMVEGISLFPIPHQGSIQAPAAAAQGLVPESVQANYGTPSSSVGGSGTQGVIEFEGQNFSPSQLQTFANGIGISISPLSSDHIKGSNDPNAPGTESTLDIQWIAGVGIGNDNWFWLFGTGKWIYGMANALANANSFPDVISISYGWSEAAQCQDGIGGAECQQLGVDSKQYVQRANTEIQKLGAKGISVFAASGDSGAPGRTDGFCQDTHVNPTYPGASPYLTAVGATQLQGSTTPLSNPPSICSGQNCVSGGQEQAVSYDHAHFASGGGFSNVATQPDYQKSAVQAYLASSAKKPPSSYFTATGRAYPDVASFGSDILISQGGTEKVGGTSAASPIFAAVWATLNQEAIKKDGKPLGFANPLLYKAPSDCFNDITVGNNAFTEDGNPFGSCKGFYCATGWDPVTGLGSPKYACMLNYVKSVLN